MQKQHESHSKNPINWIQVVFFTLVGVFIFSILLLSYVIFEEERLKTKIYPNTFINDTNIGRKTKKEAKKILNKKNDLNNIKIYISKENENIATFSAKQLNIRNNTKDVIEQAFLIGRTSHLPSKVYQKFATISHTKKFEFKTRIEYNDLPLKEFIETAKNAYNKPAEDALFSFENNKVINFKSHKIGQKINEKIFFTNIEKAIQGLKNNSKNIKINLKIERIEPKIKLSSANDFGIEELIGEGKSDYTHSAPERIHNIMIATSKFNGILIPPQEKFSFNEIIGDISVFSGYKQAYVIKSGKTVLGDGGGVCQVSTTAFRAALNTGLPIIEHHHHAYRVNYYENDSKPGLDATIFSPSVDLKFENNTPAHILIETRIDKEQNLLYFRFYGKDDKRNAEISPITVYNILPPPEAHFQDDPTLPKGVIRQIDFPAYGAKASFSYKVTKNGDVIFEKDFLANYRPWRAIYLRGTGE